MKLNWRCAAPFVVWLTIASIPHPAGLTANAWHYLALFTGGDRRLDPRADSARPQSAWSA